MNLFNIFSLLKPHKKFDNPVCNNGCDIFEVNAWTISAFVAERLLPLVGVHPFPLNEQMLMTAAVCRVRPTHIIEWGTNVGFSARIFYEICKAFSLNAEIHSIDLPDHEWHSEHPGSKRGRLVRGIHEVRLHQGDGCAVAQTILSKAAAPVKPLFFLDGDHAFKSVKQELETISCTWPDASILVHDTFYQSEGAGYNIGPWQAVSDLLLENGSHYEQHVQHLGLPGMILLLAHA